MDKIVITVRPTDYERKEIEVEFPIYRKLSLDDTDIYYKRPSIDREISITIGVGSVEIRMVNYDMREDCGTLDWHLGRGKHELSAEEFEGIARLHLAKIARFASRELCDDEARREDARMARDNADLT